MQTRYSAEVDSQFGRLAVVWRVRRGRPVVLRIALPGSPYPPRMRSCPAVDELCGSIRRMLEGCAVEPATGLLDLGSCSRFQRRVLEAECRVPRGRVISYGGLAEAAGHTGAARAVGRALAANPFPLVIPCHRTVRADGGLGGYRGGVDMKRTLLDMEGVRLSASGRIPRMLFVSCREI
ncbi:MAG: MGMT family protein [Candidatus Fermentibacteraceae bacterium]